MEVETRVHSMLTTSIVRRTLQYLIDQVSAFEQSAKEKLSSPDFNLVRTSLVNYDKWMSVKIKNIFLRLIALCYGFNRVDNNG